MPALPPPYPPAAEDPATPPPVPMVPRGPLQSPALPAIARRLRLCSSLSGRFRVPHCGGGAHGLSMETTLPRRGDQNLGRLLADLGRLTPTLYLPRARESLLTMVAASRLPGGWRRREEVLLLTARLLGGRCKENLRHWGGCGSLYTARSPWGWAGAFSCWSRPLCLPREAATGEW